MGEASFALYLSGLSALKFLRGTWSDERSSLAEYLIRSGPTKVSTKVSPE